MRCDAISLGAVDFCNDTHNKVLENIFRGKNFITMVFLGGDVESSDDESECNENIYPYDISAST